MPGFCCGNRVFTMIFSAFNPIRVFAHFLLVIVLPLSFFSGWVLAYDNPLQPQWLSQWDFLPQGDVIALHQWAAYGWLLLTAMALWQWLLNKLKKRLKTKRKSRVINIIYGLLVAQVITGVWLYLNIFEGLINIHYLLATALLIAALVHMAEQLLIKRCRYLWQIILPKKLSIAMLLSSSILVAAIATFIYWEQSWHQPLKVVALPEMNSMNIDGDFNEAYWQLAPAVTVNTSQGNDYRQSVPVEIRALHNGLVAYFAIRWPDATENREHLPLQKTEQGWTVLHDGFERDDERTYYEDKFAVMLSTLPGLAGAASIHLGPRPAADRPASRHGRGYHYTLDGSIRDVWHWKAERSEDMAVLDDDYFGPLAPNCEFCPRYTAGYHPDPQESGAVLHNWQWFKPGLITPLRLPRYYSDIQAIKANSFNSSAMPWRRTQIYDPSQDTYGIGARLPSVLYGDIYEGDRGDVRARAKWVDGYWQLELARGLKSESEYDLPIESGIYLWLATFNHAQTRHTYHLKPLQLNLEAVVEDGFAFSFRREAW